VVEKVINIGNPVLDNPKISMQQGIGSNDTSLILQFVGEGLSCLFPGDIGKQIEHELIKGNKTLQSTFLLSPHNGSKTSNSNEFLEAVSAQQIVISAGRFRPQIFPSTKLQTYCQNNKLPLLNTLKIGTITILQHYKKIEVKTFFPQKTKNVSFAEQPYR